MYGGLGNAELSGSGADRRTVVDGVMSDRKNPVFHILFHDKRNSDEFDTVYACKNCPMTGRMEFWGGPCGACNTQSSWRILCMENREHGEQKTRKKASLRWLNKRCLLSSTNRKKEEYRWSGN